jgi:hypothetical protein
MHSVDVLELFRATPPTEAGIPTSGEERLVFYRQDAFPAEDWAQIRAWVSSVGGRSFEFEPPQLPGPWLGKQHVVIHYWAVPAAVVAT